MKSRPAFAVRRMTGSQLVSLFSLMRRQSSSPCIPGIITSDTTMSHSPFSDRYFKAASPLSTSTTWYWSAKAIRMYWQRSSLSSTKRSVSLSDSFDFIFSSADTELSEVSGRLAGLEETETSTFPLSGNTIKKVVPLPSSLSNVNFPPSFCTSWRVSIKPKPLPIS